MIQKKVVLIQVQLKPRRSCRVGVIVYAVLVKVFQVEEIDMLIGHGKEKDKKAIK